jgi:hypothetical protein
MIMHLTQGLLLRYCPNYRDRATALRQPRVELTIQIKCDFMGESVSYLLPGRSVNMLDRNKNRPQTLANDPPKKRSESVTMPGTKQMTVREAQLHKLASQLAADPDFVADIARAKQERKDGKTLVLDPASKTIRPQSKKKLA